MKPYNFHVLDPRNAFLPKLWSLIAIDEIRKKYVELVTLRHARVTTNREKHKKKTNCQYDWSIK